MIDRAVEAAPTVQGRAVSIGPAVEVDSVIWTARLRTGRVVTFRVNVFRDFRAAASIAAAAVVDLAAAVIGLVAAEDLADSAVAAVGSGAVDKINAWNFQILFLEKLKTTN